MSLVIKQISALEKVRLHDELNHKETNAYTVLQGQRLSYQVAIDAKHLKWQTKKVWIESELSDYVRVYSVKEVVVDKIFREDNPQAEDYIITEPGRLPDVLVPIAHQNNLATLSDGNIVFWVKVDVPADLAPGKYTVKFFIETGFEEGEPNQHVDMEITVLPSELPEQTLRYTRWFYADCIADAHEVEIFSERHWMLIEEYIKAATDGGVNMILVPIHTPPLDTAIGITRPCVQLVDIEKKGDEYIFGFEKFRRFIDICKRSGVKFYEMAHLFSQWGSKCAPNIMVTENGKTDYMFGWHVAADSVEYTEFLKQYIAAISAELRLAGIEEQAYFHVSDEPNMTNIDRYEIAKNILKPLIGNAKTLDALSHCEFYEQGLVECPVTSIRHAHEFLKRDIKELWVYYCCGPEKVFPNSFIAMPSARVQVLGYMLYKYDIKGFLHWGLNFYNSQISLYKINPYLTTSADGAFPSGDPYILYPGKDTAYTCIRGEITFEAFQDVRICKALEALIGREAVIAMIDEAAGRDLRFDDYPATNDFLMGLRAKMLDEIAKHTK